MDNIHTKKCEKQQVYRTMISRNDLSVVVCDSLGHISIISSNTRDALNELGEKRKVGDRDSDYLHELHRPYGHYTPQVYQAHINVAPGKSTIKTKNNFDDTIFILRQDMTIDKIVNGVVFKTRQITEQEREVRKRKLAMVLNTVHQQQTTGAQKYNDLELEETGGLIEPNQRSFIFPRLFIVNNDGSAKELLSRLQLSYEIRQKGLKPEMSIK